MPFKPCSDELVVVSYLADPRQELHAAEINIIMHPEYSGLHFSPTTTDQSMSSKDSNS